MNFGEYNIAGEKNEMHFLNVPYGRDTSQKFDMICTGNDVHAVVYIHGGAYFTGNKNQYPSFLLDYSENYLFASINYRVINKDNQINMENIISDVHSALKNIHDLSKKNSVNVKDFILIGHSAGGHIALLCGYKYFQEDEKIKIGACISLAGPTDFTDDSGWSSMTMWGNNLEERLSFLSWMGTRLTCHPIELKQHNWTKQKDYPEFKKYIMEISPITYVKKEKTPPTLLVHAKNDDQVPYSNSVRLKAILESASVPHKLITPEGSGNNHMLGGTIAAENKPITFNNQAWVMDVIEWMEAYLQ